MITLTGTMITLTGTMITLTGTMITLTGTMKTLTGWNYDNSGTMITVYLCHGTQCFSTQSTRYPELLSSTECGGYILIYYRH